MTNLNKVLFHGSYTEISKPDFSHSRSDIDFGRGFYLTDNKYQSIKWAYKYRKNETLSINNLYTLDTNDLAIYCFDLNKEWLDFVIANREGYPIEAKYDIYDVLVGAVADDKLFETIDMYSQGFIPCDIALKILNCMDYGEQIVIKTQKALDHLTFLESNTISGQMKNHYKMCFEQDAIDASKKTEQLIKRYNEGKPI